MANDMRSRIKAVNLKRAKHLDLVEKETFVTFTMIVAIGFISAS